MDEKIYTLGFAAFSGIGTTRFEKLVSAFGSAESAWKASVKEIQEVIGKLTGEKFAIFRENFNPEKYAEELNKKDIHFFIPSDKEYPPLLKKLSPNYSSSEAESRIEKFHPELVEGFSTSLALRSNNNITKSPFILFAKGNTQLLQEEKTIAIVGTRKITPYGRDVTSTFAQDLSLQDFVIVSGMALGVDGVAHNTALENHGKTIAVLGSGVDIPTPYEHAQLYNRIIAQDGLIVSTFLPGQRASIGSFPARNTIIAGLSLGVLVTEAGIDSGALITAKDAKEIERPVFAVPGQITSHLSKGTNSLIQQGAVAVSSAKDIIQKLGYSSSERSESRSNSSRQARTIHSPDEQKILSLLQNGPLPFNEIVQKLGKTAQEIGTLLSIMEIKGIIRQFQNSFYLP